MKKIKLAKNVKEGIRLIVVKLAAAKYLVEPYVSFVLIILIVMNVQVVTILI